MKIVNLLFFFVCVSMSISCTDDEPTPALPPEALFLVDIEYIDIDDEIGFINKSSNGARYEWDFGDGTTATQFEPSHQYAEYGTYRVTLKVYNSDDEVDKLEIDVSIHFRSLVEVWFAASENELPENKFFFFGEVDNTSNSFFAVFPPNVAKKDLPFGGRINFGQEVLLTDRDWFWMLVDNQEPLDSFDENDRLVFGTVLNPARIVSGKDGNSATGSFPIGSTKNETGEITEDYQLQIRFEVPEF